MRHSTATLLGHLAKTNFALWCHWASYMVFFGSVARRLTFCRCINEQNCDPTSTLRQRKGQAPLPSRHHVAGGRGGGGPRQRHVHDSTRPSRLRRARLKNEHHVPKNSQGDKAQHSVPSISVPEVELRAAPVFSEVHGLGVLLPEALPDVNLYVVRFLCLVDEKTTHGNLTVTFCYYSR